MEDYSPIKECECIDPITETCTMCSSCHWSKHTTSNYIYKKKQIDDTYDIEDLKK